MNSSHQRSKEKRLEEADWISLLSDCIDSINDEQFPNRLVTTLKSITQFDYCVCFAYHDKEKPICLYDTFSAQERVVFVEDYLNGPYLLDPFFKACGRRVEPGLYRLKDVAPDRFYQSEYYRSYYVQTGLVEEICYSFYLPDGVAIAISLMRGPDGTRFTAKEFKALKRIASIVVSLAQRHWQSLPMEFESQSTELEISENHNMIEETVSTLFGSRITPRESQVVAQVLEGHSSESIARNLGISVGTARIHRRNIYGKLNISSQQELFTIFFQEIKTVRKSL
jgi:DNA-binding CsgD family transcriptional regulator